MSDIQYDNPWDWPRYNPPGLLIGPLPMIKRPSGWYAPDYSHPGVAERIKVEVDYVEDMGWERGKL